MAVELEYCGIMTRMQYRNDFFGEDNRALFPTMDLIHIQNQGIEEGVKSAATYRFMARVNNFSKAEDLAKERQRFTGCQGRRYSPIPEHIHGHQTGRDKTVGGRCGADADYQIECI